MKKVLSVLLAVLLVIGLGGCGRKETPAEEVKEWSREGFFEDDAGNMLNIQKSDMEDYPGWYVGGIFGEDMHGWYIPQEGNTLHGNIVPDYEEGEYIVTVSEEGEDGVLLEVENGKAFHFVKSQLKEAPIAISINTEGLGRFTAITDAGDLFEAEEPVTSMVLSLYEPAVYTLSALKAAEDESWVFVKWLKNGEDFSEEETITVSFEESGDYVAVFEYPESGN